VYLLYGPVLYPRAAMAQGLRLSEVTKSENTLMLSFRRLAA